MITSLQKLLMARAGAIPVDRSWDIAYASYDWNDAGRFVVSGEENSPQSLFFKPDGTKMYVIGNNGNDVNEYSLSTAWDISSASYVQNFSVSSQETDSRGLFFKPDGTKMYMVGTVGDDVNEYSLSTAWDISTASYVQNFSVASEEVAPLGLFFKPDGTKMYVTGSNVDNVNEYDLSTAWDVSTASYVQSFSVASQETSPTGLSFKSDGTKMYVLGASGDDVNEYSLSTAWDVSTASYVQNRTVSLQDSSPQGIFFKDDGTKMYMVGSTSDIVWSYSLSTAWDVSTMSWDEPSENYFNVVSEEANPKDVYFKSDGTKMYIVGSNGDEVNEYDLSTAWAISTASYVQNFSVYSQETNPGGLFFKPDGTKMYICGAGGNDINEYSLSTAWDISTASHVQIFNPATQDSTPEDVFFKDDGTKMYLLGDQNNAIYEYDLSTAWDISTSSFLQSFGIGGQETLTRGLFFKPDGTRLFVSGQTKDGVSQYNLSTAWDISTASYVQSIRLQEQVSNTIEGVSFKDDGTKMYTIRRDSKAVWEYDIG